MRYRPLGTDPDDPRLGRLLPDDWQHLERYPLTALAATDRPTQVPVVIGVNWYEQFDAPTVGSDGYWIARGGPTTLTRIRGGHAVCLEPGGNPDTTGWWEFHDQLREGSCVGWAWSRCMALLNRQRYAARWLWDKAKQRDQWPDTNPGDSNGTSVRAAGEVLIRAGHVPWNYRLTNGDGSHIVRAGYIPQTAQGITTFRWARSVDDIHAVLGNDRADKLGAVPLLNSWGKSWPRRVWLPDGVMDRLLREQGEAAVPTDR
jgi:hypothetical protein